MQDEVDMTKMDAETKEKRDDSGVEGVMTESKQSLFHFHVNDREYNKDAAHIQSKEKSFNFLDHQKEVEKDLKNESDDQADIANRGAQSTITSKIFEIPNLLRNKKNL